MVAGRTYVRGGSKLCACGKIRRAGARNCLDCHSRSARVLRLARRTGTAPLRKARTPSLVKPRYLGPSRLSKLRQLVMVYASELNMILDQAERLPWGPELDQFLMSTIQPLVRPSGLGYFFKGQKGAYCHTFFDLNYPDNKFVYTDE